MTFLVTDDKINEFVEAVCDAFGADKEKKYTLKEIEEIWFGKARGESDDEC